MDLKGYAQKLKKDRKRTENQVFAQEIVDFFNDGSVTWYNIYFGVIGGEPKKQRPKTLGKQRTFEALKSTKEYAGKNAKYFWGVVARMKEELLK